MNLTAWFQPVVSGRVLVTYSATFLAAWMLAIGPGLRAAPSPAVKFERVPGQGIQPQAALDARGTIHLVYFRGDEAAGNLFYVRREPGHEKWSSPIQVNSQPGSAIAIGTIRGAQMAVGRNGRVHVAWNGSASASPAKHPGAPMLYSRLNNAGTAFEPERDLITRAAGLDGGGSVAADEQGNVYVAWHAPIPGADEGEENRAIFVVKSTDNGRTFAPEKQASPAGLGACGCCGMKMFADVQGQIYILYRGAKEMVNRDEILLVSRNGEHFEKALSHPWNISTCPMSSAFFTAGKSATVAAWETRNKVFMTHIDRKTLKAGEPVETSSGSKQRHPVAAVNQRGETLLAWTEGTGWKKGGALAWEIFDEHGKPTGARGNTPGVPVWSFATAIAQPDGTFLIFY